MQEKFRNRFIQWVTKRPPKLPPKTMVVVTEDIRTIGKGGMLAGLVAVFNPTGGFTLVGAAFLTLAGLVLWTTAIVLHSINERVKPEV